MRVRCSHGTLHAMRRIPRLIKTIALRRELDPPTTVELRRLDEAPGGREGLLEEEGRSVTTTARARVTDSPHPVELHGPMARPALASDDHPVDPAHQAGRDLLQHRLDGDKPHNRRHLGENGDSLVPSALVLCSHSEPDVGPPVPPVGWEVAYDATRPFGQDHVRLFRSLPDDIPGLGSPRICIAVEKIRPTAREHTARVLPPLTRQGLVECRWSAAHHRRRVLPISTLSRVHVAMCAAGRDLCAPLPRIPRPVGPRDFRRRPHVNLRSRRQASCKSLQCTTRCSAWQGA